VALSGTLETFSLPDVLRLLASTKKTGLLALDGDRGTGRVWVDGGEIVAADAERAVVDDVDAVLFELLRFGDAAFEFDAAAVAPDTGTRREVEDALDVATARLEEWRDIESVVPSLDVRVRMVPELDAEVTLGPEVWRVVARVGTGASGHDVARHLGEGEYEVCRVLRDLVEDGLVEVTDEASAVERALEPPVAEPAAVAIDEPAVADAFAAMVHPPVEPTPVFEVEAPALAATETELPAPAWDAVVEAPAEPAAELSPWEVAEAELRAGAEGAPGADDLASDLALLSPKAAAAVQAAWTQDAAPGADEAPPSVEDAPAEASSGTDLDQNLLLRFLSSAKQ